MLLSSLEASNVIFIYCGWFFDKQQLIALLALKGYQQYT
jgi:hypothetical protein